MKPQNQKEIIDQIEFIQDYIENTVHPVVSPDNWHVYAWLHDEIERLQMMLEQEM